MNTLKIEMVFISFQLYHANMERIAHRKIVNAIQQCTYNKPDPDAPPGHWATWLIDHGVYSNQMQAHFCLTCGEYQYLSYQTYDHHYLPAQANRLPALALKLPTDSKCTFFYGII